MHFVPNLSKFFTVLKTLFSGNFYTGCLNLFIIHLGTKKVKTMALFGSGFSLKKVSLCLIRFRIVNCL